MDSAIVFINDYGFINGGAGNIAINSAIELAKTNNQVYFFCSVGPICDELLKSNVKCICLNQKNIRSKSKLKVLCEGINNKYAFKSLLHLAKTINFDRIIFHVHGWTKALSSSIFRVSRKKTNWKFIVTLHDYFSVCPNGGLYNYQTEQICSGKNGLKCYLCNCDKKNFVHKLFRSLRFVVQKRDMKNITNFIYISDLNKNVFLEKNKNMKVKTYFLQNFIDVPKYIINDNCLKDAFLYMGRLSNEKGAEVFCKAITISRKKGIVIGSGPLYEKLRVTYPNIEFVGWKNKEEISEYLDRTKAFIFPSVWYEGSPLTILEMMANNIPCIVSSICAGRESVLRYGGGIIYDGSISDLIEKMNIDSYPVLNQSFQLEIFSIQTHVKKLNLIYEKILMEDNRN